MARDFQQAPSKTKGKKGGPRYTDDAVSVKPPTSDRSYDPESGS
jgi:hypothetical protein